jgi:hypothetical protein
MARLTRVKMVCGTCGSENVLADAYASWNKKSQEWEVQNTFYKGGYCEDCDGETKVESKPYGRGRPSSQEAANP